MASQGIRSGRDGLARLAQIHLRSYHPKFIMDACHDIRSSAAQMGVRTSGIIPLPTHKRKYALLKSAFVHKQAIRHAGYFTHKRLIELYGESTIGQDATDVVHFLRYLEHTILMLHPSVSSRVTLYSHEMAEPPSAVAAEVARGAEL